MRSIKFRGKRRDNGEWVIGKLIADDYILGYIDLAESWGPRTDDHKLTCRAYMINPETVGQFTDKMDKNFKDIYEGDVLLICGRRLQAVFDNGCFMTIIGTDRYTLGCWGTEGIEIIGNIHDELNPLKEGVLNMNIDPKEQQAEEVKATETEMEQAPAPTAGEALENAEVTEE